MASLDKGLKIHLVGRSRTDVEAVAATLKGSGADISTRVISNGHTDPLYGVTTLPDVLILVLGDLWEEELEALAGRPPALRPPTVVIGHRDDTQAIRMAMRAGAMDYLSQPVVPGELNQALQRIIQERFDKPASARRTIAVLNAKGGSGATLIASNLAQIMAAKEGKRTALLDCDLQFGTQALHLDLRPTYDMTMVLQAINGLDKHALQGYMAKHRSGLHLLAAPTDRLALFEEISPQSLGRLIDVIGQTYNRIIIDLPRLLNAVSTVALEQADFVIVVMQQTLAAIQNAKRLTGVLQTELEIPRERIVVAVNRYHPKHPIKADDILQTLQQRTLVLIPNDYARVETSASQGIPLYEAAPNAPITKALVQLAFQLGGETIPPPTRGVIGRAKAWFSRQSA